MLNSIPKTLQVSLKKALNSIEGNDLDLLDFNFSSGGCINRTGTLETNVGKYFLKWNSKSRYPDMFEKEMRGLELLRAASHSLKIPKPILTDSNEDYIFLVLENIEPVPRNSSFWKNLGIGLAKLHRNENNNYGLDYRNYIGSLNQFNEKSNNWLEFFRANRIEYTFKKANDSGFFESSDRQNLDRLFIHLDKICPKNIKPSLIHGDLWSGNLMVDNTGEPCLIDPAVYYGFREMEIAFTELFGGYDQTFYDTYNESWQLEPGYEERKDIWNLYPLLVHVNLFGASYLSSVKSILRRFK